MSSPELEELFAQLDALEVEQTEQVRVAGERMRSHLVAQAIPAAVETEVVEHWRDLGEEHAYAVRSSATAEDLPGASFAGQHDTYLNVVGQEALLDSLRACWASLFTDRAITYRARNGFDHRKVRLCVVVQRMVLPVTSGIAFTADPVDGRRHIVSIDAGFGLGEALVSGAVSADLYKVDKRTYKIVEKHVSDKRLAILPRHGGGTDRVTLSEDQRLAQALSDEQIVELATLAARVANPIYQR
jgi:pyruvate,water dikinase